MNKQLQLNFENMSEKLHLINWFKLNSDAFAIYEH
jgi:hypothetical protein